MSLISGWLPTIAVCGIDAKQVEETGRSVAGALGWGIRPVLWPDGQALAAAHEEPVRGYVVVGDAPAALAKALQGRPREAALIAIGGAPSVELQPSCWLPTHPPEALLAALLGQLTPGGGKRERSWRRKSDMIVGQSAALDHVLHLLDRFTPSAAPVLVTGESGTGKELVARALHYTGARASAPFVAANCAAIPAPLFEAELFGHVRGAFTGAVAARAGLFEAADGGTLFLDEIGDLPLALQPKLLRVLETGEVQRIGATETRRCNVRVVSATNRQLEEEVFKGTFREDLYYRVRVCHVAIPPLRERPEDVPALVNHHLAMIATRERRPIPPLTRGALQKLVAYRWPGNVRELVNALERAVVVAPNGGPIDGAHIELPDAQPAIASYRDAKERFEQAYYAHLLRAARGNVAHAARIADKTRKEVYDAVKRIGLDVESFRDGAEPAPSPRGRRSE